MSGYNNRPRKQFYIRPNYGYSNQMPQSRPPLLPAPPNPPWNGPQVAGPPNPWFDVPTPFFGSINNYVPRAQEPPTISTNVYKNNHNFPVQKVNVAAMLQQSNNKPINEDNNCVPHRRNNMVSYPIPLKYQETGNPGIGESSNKYSLNNRSRYDHHSKTNHSLSSSSSQHKYSNNSSHKPSSRTTSSQESSYNKRNNNNNNTESSRQLPRNRSHSSSSNGSNRSNSHQTSSSSSSRNTRRNVFQETTPAPTSLSVSPAAPTKPVTKTKPVTPKTAEKLPKKLDRTTILKLVNSTTKYEPAMQKLLREQRSKLTQNLRSKYNDSCKEMANSLTFTDEEITDGIIPNFTLNLTDDLQFLQDALQDVDEKQQRDDDDDDDHEGNSKRKLNGATTTSPDVDDDDDDNDDHPEDGSEDIKNTTDLILLDEWNAEDKDSDDLISYNNYDLGPLEIPSNIDELQLPSDVSSFFNFTEINKDDTTSLLNAPDSEQDFFHTVKVNEPPTLCNQSTITATQLSPIIKPLKMDETVKSILDGSVLSLSSPLSGEVPDEENVVIVKSPPATPPQPPSPVVLNDQNENLIDICKENFNENYCSPFRAENILVKNDAYLSPFRKGKDNDDDDDDDDDDTKYTASPFRTETETKYTSPFKEEISVKKVATGNDDYTSFPEENIVKCPVIENSVREESMSPFRDDDNASENPTKEENYFLPFDDDETEEPPEETPIVKRIQTVKESKSKRSKNTKKRVTTTAVKRNSRKENKLRKEVMKKSKKTLTTSLKHNLNYFRQIIRAEILNSTTNSTQKRKFRNNIIADTNTILLSAPLKSKKRTRKNTTVLLPLTTELIENHVDTKNITDTVLSAKKLQETSSNVVVVSKRLKTNNKLLSTNQSSDDTVVVSTGNLNEKLIESSCLKQHVDELMSENNADNTRSSNENSLENTGRKWRSPGEKKFISSSSSSSRTSQQRRKQFADNADGNEEILSKIYDIDVKIQKLMDEKMDLYKKLMTKELHVMESSGRSQEDSLDTTTTSNRTNSNVVRKLHLEDDTTSNTTSTMTSGVSDSLEQQKETRVDGDLEEKSIEECMSSVEKNLIQQSLSLPQSINQSRKTTCQNVLLEMLPKTEMEIDIRDEEIDKRVMEQQTTTSKSPSIKVENSSGESIEKNRKLILKIEKENAIKQSTKNSKRKARKFLYETSSSPAKKSRYHSKDDHHPTKVDHSDKENVSKRKTKKENLDKLDNKKSSLRSIEKLDVKKHENNPDKVKQENLDTKKSDESTAKHPEKHEHNSKKLDAKKDSVDTKKSHRERSSSSKKSSRDIEKPSKCVNSDTEDVKSYGSVSSRVAISDTETLKTTKLADGEGGGGGSTSTKRRRRDQCYESDSKLSIGRHKNKRKTKKYVISDSDEDDVEETSKQIVDVQKSIKKHEPNQNVNIESHRTLRRSSDAMDQQQRISKKVVVAVDPSGKKKKIEFDHTIIKPCIIPLVRINPEEYWKKLPESPSTPSIPDELPSVLEEVEKEEDHQHSVVKLTDSSENITTMDEIGFDSVEISEKCIEKLEENIVNMSSTETTDLNKKLTEEPSVILTIPSSPSSTNTTTTIISTIPVDNINDGESSTKELDFYKCANHSGSILYVKIYENTIIAAGEDGKLYKYNVNNGDLLGTVTAHQAAITSFYIAKNKQDVMTIYTGSLDSHFKCFNFENLTEVTAIQIETSIQCMDADWGYIFIGTVSGHLYRYSIQQNSIDDEKRRVGDQAILAIKTTREGGRRVLISAPRNELISIRDAMSGLLLRYITFTTSVYTIYSLMLYDSMVYCGTNKKVILGYDFTDGKLVRELLAGKGIVCLLEYHKLLFAGCYDGYIYVFDMVTNTQITKFLGPGGMILALDVMDNKVIIGSKNSSLEVRTMPTPVLEYLCENRR